MKRKTKKDLELENVRLRAELEGLKAAIEFMRKPEPAPVYVPYVQPYVEPWQPWNPSLPWWGGGVVYGTTTAATTAATTFTVAAGDTTTEVRGEPFILSLGGTNAGS